MLCVRGSLAGHPEGPIPGRCFVGSDGSLPTYLGVSLEAGNVWQQRADFELDDLIYSGAFYVGVSTPLGPIFLGYGRSSEGEDSVYLNFGSLIRSRYQ